MIRTALAALCLMSLSGCALFEKSKSNFTAATPAAIQPTSPPAATPIALRTSAIGRHPKATARVDKGPRALVPCFGDNPLANACRWDGAIDHQNQFDDIRADARKSKSPLINVASESDN